MLWCPSILLLWFADSLSSVIFYITSGSLQFILLFSVFWLHVVWLCFLGLIVLLWFLVLLWFHDWVLGKLVDFGSRVRSVVFGCLSAWVLAVCSSLVNLGVHAIDSSLPTSICFFVPVCLCMFPLWVISWQCLKLERMFADPYFPISSFLSDNKVPVFRLLCLNSASLFWGFCLKHVFCPKTTAKEVNSANYSFAILALFVDPLTWFKNRPPLPWITGSRCCTTSRAHFSTLWGGTSVRQVAATAENDKHQTHGGKGFWSRELSASHGNKGLLYLQPAKHGPKPGHIYMCIYIYAVELKTGPMFTFSSVKNWSIFVFLFWKSHSPCRKKRIFQNKKQKKHF